MIMSSKTEYSSKWVRGHCIGRGSFGTVNIALSQPDSKLFAVKSVQNSGDSIKSNQIQALENEIRILNSLPSSPWIVNYIGDDVTFERGFSYRNLHMEYMPGGTAANLPVLSAGEDVVKSYTYCIVSALRHIHSRGVIHCDVKGSNVLFGTHPGVAKLADFGSAMVRNNDGPPRGSPLWMAPEVVRGEYQGPESDVWSLGCTVIEIMTGKPVWKDCGSHTLIQIGYSENLPDFPSGLSRGGRDFLEKCLRRDRKERWSCDMLLRHPFIVSSEPSIKSMFDCPSPRLTLDWALGEPETFLSDEADVDSSKVRIEKLATETEVIWESDGWSEVRNSVVDCDRDRDEKQRGLEHSISSSNSNQNTGANMECHIPDTQQIDGRWQRPDSDDGYAMAGEDSAACKSQFNKKSKQLTFSLLHLLCSFFYKCKFIFLLLLIHNFHTFGHSKLCLS